LPPLVKLRKSTKGGFLEDREEKYPREKKTRGPELWGRLLSEVFRGVLKSGLQAGALGGARGAFFRHGILARVHNTQGRSTSKAFKLNIEL